jgi:site-specific recombinase
MPKKKSRIDRIKGNVILVITVALLIVAIFQLYYSKKAVDIMRIAAQYIEEEIPSYYTLLQWFAGIIVVVVVILLFSLILKKRS